MRLRLVLLAAALFALCPIDAGLAQETGETPPPSIGVALPLSGDYSAVGKQLLESAQLAASEKEMRLVVEDTEGTPKGAAAAVARLAEKPEVVAVVGGVGRRESRAAASMAARKGLPLLTLSSDERVNVSSGWVFRMRMSPAEQARRLAAVSRTRLSVERVAILYPQDDYGRSAAIAFAREFADRGGVVAAVANYPKDTTDFRDVLDVVAGKKVYLGRGARVGRWRADSHGFAPVASKPRIDFDALFIPDFHDRVARILPFLPVAGMQNGSGGDGTAVELLGLSGWQGRTMEFAGTTAAGARYVDLFVGEAVGGSQESFSRTFEAKYERRPVDVEVETFDAVWLAATIVENMQKAGRDLNSVGRPELVRRLPRDRAFEGVCGPLRFGPRGEPIRTLELYEFDADGLVSPAGL